MSNPRRGATPGSPAWMVLMAKPGPVTLTGGDLTSIVAGLSALLARDDYLGVPRLCAADLLRRIAEEVNRRGLPVPEPLERMLAREVEH